MNYKTIISLILGIATFCLVLFICRHNLTEKSANASPQEENDCIIKTLLDSKGRPHRVAIIMHDDMGIVKDGVVDLDVSTYIGTDSVCYVLKQDKDENSTGAKN